MAHIVAVGLTALLFSFGAATTIGTTKALQNWAVYNFVDSPIQLAERI
jgi:hypothetical protein